MPDPARVGDSNANGAAEGAVKEVKAKVRTIVAATQEMLKVTIGAQHACLPFLVMYAASSINRGRRGPDGKTAYELRFGKAWHGKWAQFGEKVMWLPTGKRTSRLDTGYRHGVFLGVIEGSNQYYIGVPGKVVVASALKLLDTGQRADREMFEAVRGLPWQMDPMVVAGPVQQVVPTQLHAGPVAADAQLPAQRTEAEWITMARRVYSRKDVELVKHGFTPGCDGCNVVASGVGPPRNHSDECRLRIVKAMADDPDGQPSLAAAASRQDTKKKGSRKSTMMLL